MSLLRIADLRLSIYGTPILRGVSLDVAPGEIHGLIGESGSGKSLTALATMGLPPEGAALAGSIRLEGADLVGLGERAYRDLRGQVVGMVFQEPMTALNPVATIGDQVAETVRVHGRAGRAEAARIARETLDRVGLPAAQFPLDRYPHELSGGQRQRVVIAMAIALRPKLLIADEPTTALDVLTQAQILELLKGLVLEQRMGLLLITHDLGVVASMAHRISIMRRGEIVEQGAALPLLRAARHPYTRALRDASTHQPIRRRRPEEGGPPVLAAEAVTRLYPGRRRGLFGRGPAFRAVDGVSFEIRRGEILGLVGESGCGKSTLSRAVLALDPVQGGVIRLSGAALDARAGVDRAARRQMQAVFQDPYGSFNPRWTVERLVAEPFALLDAPPSADEARARVAALLEEVGLSAADLGKYSHEFSGGQRQRLAIARALLIEPALIVLDEAVSALDVSIRAQILDLVADLSDRRGVAFLFVTHDLTVVRAIADRVLVMRAGRIVEEGPTRAVFSAPRDPYTQELIAAAPSLEAALGQETQETQETKVAE